MRAPEDVLAEAAVALGRALRDGGIPAGVDGELTFASALAELDVARREHVYWAARAAFLRSPEELSVFEATFARFWAGLPLGRPGPPIAEHGESDPRMPGPQHGGESLPQFRQEGRSADLLEGGGTRSQRPLELAATPGEQRGAGRQRGLLAAYSPEEALTEREQPDFGADELAAVRRLADDLRAAAPERRSRRLRESRQRGRLDVRRTLRRALETEGEALRPAYAAPSRRPRRLVFLCDVSGSMERWSRALLASLGGVVGAGIRAEAFVFATRLTRLTRDLAGQDVARALEEARGAVPDWSGGTRIGAALAEFRRTYGRLGLARGAVVVIASDGWDRGDPDLLTRELAQLRLECRRLVWLNPRPSDLDGQPLAVGMRVALPYVDDFVPGHDPRAAARLVELVGGLGAGRPARPQRLGFAAR